MDSDDDKGIRVRVNASIIMIIERHNMTKVGNMVGHEEQIAGIYHYLPAAF